MYSIPKLRQRVPVIGSVSVAHTTKGQVVSETTPEPNVVAAHNPAFGKVRLGGSVTQNMGDYNSIKVTVEAELPASEPGVTGLDAAYNTLTAWVDEKVQNELDKAMGVEK